MSNKPFRITLLILVLLVVIAIPVAWNTKTLTPLAAKGQQMETAPLQTLNQTIYFESVKLIFRGNPGHNSMWSIPEY